MNASMTVAGRFSLLICLAIPLQAADPAARLFAKSGSKVTISGSNNFHDWEVQGSAADVLVEFGAGFPTTSGGIVKLGKVEARLEGSIPVRSLHGNEGKPMDKAMYELLKEATHPRISFRLCELNLKAIPKQNDDSYLFDSQCELVVAGATNRVSMPMAVTLLGGQNLRMTGSSLLNLTALGIQPPEFKFSGTNGTLKYRDEIKLRFDWFVGPPAAPGTKD